MDLGPPDVARELGVSRQYAARVIKQIPGAYLRRQTPTGREVWRVPEDRFHLWQAGFRFPQLTG